MKTARVLGVLLLCMVLFTTNAVFAGTLTVTGRALGSDGVTALPGTGLPVPPEAVEYGYVQCIHAGPDGVMDPPGLDGLPGGDDVLLETEEYPGQYFTAVGEGYPFNPNGRFNEDFRFNLGIGSLVYVRVWNGATPANSTWYGDSGLYAIENTLFDAHDFGTWDTDTSLDPTLVVLLSFTATGLQDSVLVQWTTASEIDHEGFNLLRSEAAAGPYARINAALIPGTGDPFSGADYSYTDLDVVTGKRYFYKLEAVDITGLGERFGPVSATVSQGWGAASTVAAGAAGGSGAASGLLLVLPVAFLLAWKGLRRRQRV
jgi:hypothetical protein